jgi:RNA polymerase sigma-70 factor (ECF subfamily)
MAVDNFQFISRSLRRLGVPDEGVDDAAQRTFEIASRKLDVIEPGHERAFLFKTAILVATEARRRARTRREVADNDRVDEEHCDGLNPEEALAVRRNRQLLDEVLEALPLELRTVFVLFELEGLSSVDVAALLEIPVGTVASRLRRAREEFHAAAKRLRARLAFPGGKP